ncbi:MAG: SDR family NAD(P)-dependent oxidoreductase [Candidatus Thiodiazotropha sp. (ex Ctena orbiculata)]|nr:SDR family NAD(P)-dependent oxidoreductase [Candidatus Thiodiazotropha taylori]PUB90180.1 MAG: hypothetical protein DBP00_00360 [gamma proteobacterium symbiont of Ctena orbiculata]MBT2998227.1 SDR family NAD(P)-dependent oxidoreductase [Candidatus Thiodiazotropha taylori]MBT3002525.1 SDR family NAD(P)-dependent oxidoreductase [Candidatus Thiodiazotropha taylori]MBT3028369.1 SDR family NAD(P)-dependent oxidoreductase [Candidatus Thiodiazotropha taylori]
MKQNAKKQQIALVTGASSGMGRDFTEALLAEGLVVYAVARRLGRMADLERAGAIPLKMDITQQKQVDAVIEKIEAEHGGVDLLINNAGFGMYGAMEVTTIEDARYQFEVNLFGLAYLTQRAIPSMRAKRAGKIVNVSSIGHSMGGLVIRAYLDRQRPQNLVRVVMIGTPNQGTDFVDRYRDHWWMQMAGEAALALGTEVDSFPNSLPIPDYPLGVIAGYRENSLQEDAIAGLDDGLVPVRSTLIEGMDDFILIETGHSAMRYDSSVAEQTVHFLKNGVFKR